MANMEELKHAVNKGEILTLLKGEYPEFIDFFILRMAMNNLGKALLEKELAGYLYYLAEAGYVEVKKDSNLFILCARLTKNGMDVANGWKHDPAIVVK